MMLTIEMLEVDTKMIEIDIIKIEIEMMDIEIIDTEMIIYTEIDTEIDTETVMMITIEEEAMDETFVEGKYVTGRLSWSVTCLELAEVMVDTGNIVMVMSNVHAHETYDYVQVLRPCPLDQRE